jgi:hypothetical protein
MKVITRARVAREVFDKYPEALKRELTYATAAEIAKHDVFTEVIEEDTHSTRMELQIFVLSKSDISRLERLAEKYPEISEVLRNIVREVDI